MIEWKMESLQHGWLYMQAGIFKRWKKKWFNLSHHGSLTIAPRPYAQPDDMFDLTSECTKILFGEECIRKIKRQKENPETLIYIECDVTTLVLAAPNQDQFMDWKTALELAVISRLMDSWSKEKESPVNQSDCSNAEDKTNGESQNTLPLPTARQQIESMYCKRTTPDKNRH